MSLRVMGLEVFRRRPQTRGSVSHGASIRKPSQKLTHALPENDGLIDHVVCDVHHRFRVSQTIDQLLPVTDWPPNTPSDQPSTGTYEMTVTTENQTVILTHKRQGIASSIIGATSIVITSLLVGTAMRGTEPPRPMIIALGVLSSAMLCANLIGIALGFFGAKDRSSRKLYPLLGLTLNLAILMAFVALALIGLSSMRAP
jgi:hypothetical protein